MGLDIHILDHYILPLENSQHFSIYLSLPKAHLRLDFQACKSNNQQTKVEFDWVTPLYPATDSDFGTFR